MNILVINGSPNGVKGTSHQTILFLEQQFPEHRFEVIEAARRIHLLERDAAAFQAVVDKMSEADAVIWSYPVYFMLVPSQLQRFIELLFERADLSRLAGKPATQISSSAHFYDHTAHDHLHGISSDLQMSPVRGFCASMEDLCSEQSRASLKAFAHYFFQHAPGQVPVDAPALPVRSSAPSYRPVLDRGGTKSGHNRIVVITDAGPEDKNLQRMIDAFDAAVSHPVDRLDLIALNMKGGCLGCMRCADRGECAYNDDYAKAFDERVKPADVVIYAGTIRNRFFSARIKMFIDRYFRNGHRPVGGKQLVGYLVSGPLRDLPSMKEVLEANMEMGQGQRLGIVTDEHPDPAATTARLQSMARTVDQWLAEPWYAPATFLGVGGSKIFRDLVYENRGVLTADHHYYREHGLYDFPQKKFKKWIFMALVLLCKRIPFLKRRVVQGMRGGHLRQARKALA